MAAPAGAGGAQTRSSSAASAQVPNGVDPKQLQRDLETLWQGLASHCDAGGVEGVPSLVKKLKQCTVLTRSGSVRMSWARVVRRAALPFVLRALIDSSQTAPIAELDLSDNQLGDEHAMLVTSLAHHSVHLRTLDVSHASFSQGSVDTLRAAAQQKGIRLLGCVTPAPPSASLPPRPILKSSPLRPPSRTPVHAADVAALQDKVDGKVRDLGLQHAGQLEAERDALLRELSLPNAGAGGTLPSPQQQQQHQQHQHQPLQQQSLQHQPHPQQDDVDEFGLLHALRGRGEASLIPRQQQQQQPPQPQQQHSQPQLQPQQQPSGSQHRSSSESSQHRYHQHPSPQLPASHRPPPSPSGAPETPGDLRLASRRRSSSFNAQAPDVLPSRSYTPLRDRVSSPGSASAAASLVDGYGGGGGGGGGGDSTPQRSFRSLNAHALSSKGAPICIPSRTRHSTPQSPFVSKDLSLLKADAVGAGGGAGHAAAASTAESEGLEDDRESAYDVGDHVPDSFVIRDYSRMKLTSLEHKDLSRITVLILRHNAVRRLSNLPPGLERLDVSSNELTNLAGLQACPRLHTVVARHNRITKIAPALENCREVTTLLLGHNKIRRAEGLEHLAELTYLDLGSNELSTPASIRTLSLNTALTTLVLRGNPLSHPSGRRRICISNLPASTTEADLHALLRPYGSVEGVMLLGGRAGTDGRLAAFAIFASADVVAKACATVLSQQEPAPGVPPFKVELRGKKGRMVLSGVDGSVDRPALMQLLSMHGSVESLEVTQPQWERQSPRGWVAFDAAHTTRLDAALLRQGVCKVGGLTVRMGSMTAETPGGVVPVRTRREATAQMTAGTLCAERARAALSGVLCQGDTVGLVVRHMPDYQPLVTNLLPHLRELDRRMVPHTNTASVAPGGAAAALGGGGRSAWSSLIDASDASVGPLDVSTVAAQQSLTGTARSSHDGSVVPSPGYSQPGQARRTLARMDRAKLVQSEADKRLRRFGLQPGQQGEIVRQHSASRRSRSAPDGGGGRVSASAQQQPPAHRGASASREPQWVGRLTKVPDSKVPESKSLVPSMYRRGGSGGGGGGGTPLRSSTPPMREAARPGGGGGGGGGSRPQRQSSRAREASTPTQAPLPEASVDSTQGELRSALRRLTSAVSDASRDPRALERKGVSFTGRPCEYVFSLPLPSSRGSCNGALPVAQVSLSLSLSLSAMHRRLLLLVHPPPSHLPNYSLTLEGVALDSIPDTGSVDAMYRSADDALYGRQSVSETHPQMPQHEDPLAGLLATHTRNTHTHARRS